MTRINIYEYDEYDGKHVAGWFDPDAATRYDEDREWDGTDMIGVITRSCWEDQYLYRTKGGRWVLNQDSHRLNNGPDTYTFITDQQAHNWLIASQGNDDAIAEHFGELEEERGPGRPGIGPAFSLRFPTDLLTKVDEAAKNDGLSRAEKIRQLVEAGL